MSAKRQRWEHTILCVEGDRVHANEQLLNNFGAEGWELVAVTAYTATHYLYLRRARASRNPPAPPQR